MYAVIRRYSGPGAAQLFDELERQTKAVEELLRAVPGFVSYTLARTDEGGVSVTVCQDQAGTEASVKAAADFIRQNVKVTADPPAIAHGAVILHIS